MKSRESEIILEEGLTGWISALSLGFERGF